MIKNAVVLYFCLIFCQMKSLEDIIPPPQLYQGEDFPHPPTQNTQEQMIFPNPPMLTDDNPVVDQQTQYVLVPTPLRQNQFEKMKSQEGKGMLPGFMQTENYLPSQNANDMLIDENYLQLLNQNFSSSMPYEYSSSSSNSNSITGIQPFQTIPLNSTIAGGNFANIQEIDYQKYFDELNKLEYQKIMQSINSIGNIKSNYEQDSQGDLGKNSLPEYVIDLPQNRKDIESMYQGIFQKINDNNTLASHLPEQRKTTHSKFPKNESLPWANQTSSHVENTQSHKQIPKHYPRFKSISDKDLEYIDDISEFDIKKKEHHLKTSMERMMHDPDPDHDVESDTDRYDNFLGKIYSRKREKLMKGIEYLTAKRTSEIKTEVRVNLANCKSNCDRTCSRVSKLKKTETEEKCKLKCDLACSNNALNKLLL